MPKTKPKVRLEFELARYLESGGVAKKIHKFRKGQTIYSQGDPSPSVLYIQQGNVKISVGSRAGKEAVIAILRQGDFFGESSIAGHPLRLATATAMHSCKVLEIENKEMTRLLREEETFSHRFLAYLLKRNVRVEADLVDQLFNSSEKRLARALLLLASYGKEPTHQTLIARISQETLAEMVGTTRGRISFFMNKFRKLGFIKYNGGLQINDSLTRVLLYDGPSGI